MALIEDASYANAGSNVVISDIPASGVIYTCLLGGAFTGVAGWLLPPNRSQAVKSMVIKQSRSIVYFLPGYIFDDSLLVYISAMIHIPHHGRPQGSSPLQICNQVVVLSKSDSAQCYMQKSLDVDVAERGRPAHIFFARCLHNLHRVSLVSSRVCMRAGQCDGCK